MPHALKAFCSDLTLWLSVVFIVAMVPAGVIATKTATDSQNLASRFNAVTSIVYSAGASMHKHRVQRVFRCEISALSTDLLSIFCGDFTHSVPHLCFACHFLLITLTCCSITYHVFVINLTCLTSTLTCFLTTITPARVFNVLHAAFDLFL